MFQYLCVMTVFSTVGGGTIKKKLKKDDKERYSLGLQGITDC